MRMTPTMTLGKAVFLWPRNSWIEAQARSPMTSLMTTNQTPRRGKPRKRAFKRSKTLSSGPRKTPMAQKPKLLPRNRRRLTRRRSKRSKPNSRKKSSTTSHQRRRKSWGTKLWQRCPMSSRRAKTKSKGGSKRMSLLTLKTNRVRPMTTRLPTNTPNSSVRMKTKPNKS